MKQQSLYVTLGDVRKMGKQIYLIILTILWFKILVSTSSSSILSSSSTTLTLMVSDVDDNGSNTTVTSCSGNNTCSLRHAWDICLAKPEILNCTIVLPSSAQMTHNTSFGPLLWKQTSPLTHLCIVGNNATIVASPPSLSTRTSLSVESFPRSFDMAIDEIIEVPLILVGADSTVDYELYLSTCSFDIMLVNDPLKIGVTLTDSSNNPLSSFDTSSSMNCEVGTVYKYYLSGGNDTLKLSIQCNASESAEGCLFSMHAYIIPIVATTSFEHSTQFLNVTNASFLNLHFSNFTLSGFGDGTVEQGGAVEISHVKCVSLSAMEFSSNLGRRGGAIALQSVNFIAVQNCRFSDNIAMFDGGSMMVKGISNFDTRAVFVETVFDANTAMLGSGGALWATGTKMLTMFNTLCTNSSSMSLGGCVGVTDSEEVEIYGLMADSTSSLYKGGTVFCNTSSMITFTNITVNGSQSRWGGAIWLEYASAVVADIVKIENVMAWDTPGFGIDRSTDISLSNVSVHISLSEQSGSIKISECIGAAVTNVVVEDSVAALGAGLFINTSSNIYFDTIDLQYTYSTSHGGGIFCDGVSSLGLHNVTISGAVADKYGGSFSLRNSHDISVEKLNILESSSLYAAGALDIESVYRSSWFGIKIVGAESNYMGGCALLSDVVGFVAHDWNLEKCKTADGDGGAIFISACDSVKFNALIIVEAYAMVYGKAMEIIYSDNIEFGNMLIDRSIYRDGDAGLGNIDLYFVNNFTIRDSVFSNSYMDSGAGLLTSDCRNFSLNRVSFFNQSSVKGAGIYGVEMDGVVLTDITVEHGYSVSEAGFALIVQCQHVLLQRLRISDVRSGINGGAIFLRNLANVTVEDIVIHRGYSLRGGGAIILFVSHLTMNNVQVYDSISGAGGGGIWFEELDYCNISNIVVNNGSSTLDRGGGVLIQTCRFVNVENVTVINSFAKVLGGGVALYTANEVFLTNIIVLSSYSDVTGGGVAVLSSQNVSLRNMIIANCIAAVNGGGFYLKDSTNVAAINFTVTNASSLHGDGGGIYLELSKYIHLEYFVVTESQALLSNGGGLSVTECSEVDILMGRIFHNTAANNGGGMYVDTLNSGIFVSNSSIEDNYAGYCGGGMYVSTYNKKLMWLNRRSMTSIENYVVGEIRQDELFTQRYNFPGAIGIVIYADDSSYFDRSLGGCCHELEIRPFGSPRGSNVLLFVTGWIGSLPAVGTAPLFLDNITDIVIETGRVAADGRSNSYIFLFVVPIYPGDNLDHDIILRNNRAEQDGGGLMFATANTPFVVNNLLIQNNHVVSGNGGGVVLETGNNKAVFIRGTIENNVANELGGGIYIGYSQYHLEMYYVTIRNNTAKRFGGGISLYSNNQYITYGGVKAVTTSIEEGLVVGLQCTYCNITENRILGGSSESGSDNGGAGMYLNVHCAVKLLNSIVQKNIVFANADNTTTTTDTSVSNGGGLLIGQWNTVILKNVNVQGNIVLQGSGGGIALIDTKSRLYCTSVSISDNTATNGGGLLVAAASQLTFSGPVKVCGNTANDAGGAMLIANAPLWTFSTSSDENALLIEGNIANRGSGLFLHAITTTDISLGNVAFVRNRAKRGTTVYWIRSNVMSALPVDFSNNSLIHWANGSESNVESYGYRVSTQPMTIHVARSRDILYYGTPITPAIALNITDSYGQIVTSSHDLILDAAIESFQCLQVKRPYLSGGDMITPKAVMQGKCLYEALRAYCHPQGNLTISFTMALSPLDGIPTTTWSNAAGSNSITGSYDLQVTTQLLFRACRSGEYINRDSECMVCPTGSYSLTFTDGEGCVSCAKTSGVRACYGNVLDLEAGYWRRHNSSTAVLSCVSGDSIACMGGIGVGDTLCNLGYTGALCGSCSSAYYMTGEGRCVPCESTSSSMTAGDIIALTLVILVVLIAVLFTCCISSEQDKTDFDKKAKATQSKNARRMSAVIMSTTTAAVSTVGCTGDLVKRLKVVRKFVDRFKRQLDNLTVKLKIVVATFQIATSTANVFDVSLPPSFTRFMSIFHGLNLNIAQLVPVGCMWSITFYDRLRVVTLTPIGILIALMTCMCIELGLVRWRSQRAIGVERKVAGSGDKENEMNVVAGRYLNYVFYLSYLVLPSVSTSIFQVYVCTNIDPLGEDNDSHDHYLLADLSLPCYTDEHKFWIAYGYIMIALYPIGIPLFYWMCLYTHRHELVNRPQSEGVDRQDEGKENQSDTVKNGETINDKREIETKELSLTAMRLSFLWEAYQPQYWYWELIETLRRILLTAVLSIIARGSLRQAVFGCVLAYFISRLYSYFQPYSQGSDGVLAEVGQMQIFLTYFATLVIAGNLLSSNDSSSGSSSNNTTDSVWNTMMGGLMVTINLSVLVIGFYQEVLSTVVPTLLQSMCVRLGGSSAETMLIWTGLIGSSVPVVPHPVPVKKETIPVVACEADNNANDDSDSDDDGVNMVACAEAVERDTIIRKEEIENHSINSGKAKVETRDWQVVNLD